MPARNEGCAGLNAGLFALAPAWLLPAWVEAQIAFDNASSPLAPSNPVLLVGGAASFTGANQATPLGIAPTTKASDFTPVLGERVT